LRSDADYSAFSIDRKPRGSRWATKPNWKDIIRRLFYRMDDAREGSVERRMIVRQLIGLREGSEVGRLIFEGFNMIAIGIGIPELVARDARSIHVGELALSLPETGARRVNRERQGNKLKRDTS
jgi:hypothetical protein